MFHILEPRAGMPPPAPKGLGMGLKARDKGPDGASTALTAAGGPSGPGLLPARRNKASAGDEADCIVRLRSRRAETAPLVCRLAGNSQHLPHAGSGARPARDDGGEAQGACRH